MLIDHLMAHSEVLCLRKEPRDLFRTEIALDTLMNRDNDLRRQFNEFGCLGALVKGYGPTSDDSPFCLGYASTPGIPWIHEHRFLWQCRFVKNLLS